MISCGTILLLCLAVRFMFLRDTVKCLCVLSLFFAHVKNRFCLFVANKTHVPLASRSLPCYSVVVPFCQGDTNMNEDLVKENRKPKFATVNYIAKKEKYSDEDLAKINSFIKISPIGTQNIKTNIDANIDRGSSALFERLNILGEVKSMRDLENYKNNFFDI